MKRMLFLATIALISITLLMPRSSFAGGDPCIYQSSHTDSEGNESTYITNRDARNLNKYIRYTKGSGYVYKNYNKITPNSNKSLSGPGVSSSSTIKAPYSHYDVTFNANSRSLEPIIVSYIGAPGGQLDISPIIMRESMRYNVDPLLVRTVIKYESGFCASALSPAGACGLMQLMPGTAEALGVSDVFSPYQNISGGVQYIRRQLDNFGGNVALALAAYNAGPGAVFANGGIPPYAETQSYVYMILSDYLNAAKVAKRKGGTYSTSVGSTKEKQIDVISTLSKMKGGTSGVTETSTCSNSSSNAQPSPQVTPLPVNNSSATQNLLENRSPTQGNPLENKPTATVPGY